MVKVTIQSELFNLFLDNEAVEGFIDILGKGFQEI